uniref:Prenyl (decaprenyl) diphosphate synthase, subunit 1 n=1 Tax=Sinocyclocheilus grahami TaxID=75366 RepID=A0A672K2J1_SINGR
MAVPWSAGAAVLLDWCCGFSRRAFTHAASAGRRTESSTAATQVNMLTCFNVQKTHSFSNTVHYCRHRNRCLYTTPRVCCSIRSDAKLKDPFSLAQKDLQNVYEDIKKLLVSKAELKALCDYYFDGKGKAFRPMIVILMARACNVHSNKEGVLLPAQRSIAMISEMIHTASLVHDDVIDDSDTRRGKNTINKVWGERKVGNKTGVTHLKGIVHPKIKISIAVLLGTIIVHEQLACVFQLVDDILDFTSSANLLGKPSAADLKLGLATGPVLFACQQFPELHAMIMRRFSSDGDVDRAWQYVLKSDGVKQTNYLAQHYCQEAIRQIIRLQPSTERDALIQLTELVLRRDK